MKPRSAPSPSSVERMILPCIWYFLPFVSMSPGYCVLPSSSHLPLKPGTMSSMRASKRAPVTPHMSKNTWLAQTMRESLSENTAIGRGKFISVLFLAVSAS